MSLALKCSVTFKMQQIPDSDPDLSYLTQSYEELADPVERATYQAQNACRLAAYHKGEWDTVGIRAIAVIEVTRGQMQTAYTLESAGVWGIESDSGDEYFRQVFEEECAELKADIACFKLLELAA